jgi:hypothetical protein
MNLKCHILQHSTGQLRRKVGSRRTEAGRSCRVVLVVGLLLNELKEFAIYNENNINNYETITTITASLETLNSEL